MYLIPFNLWVGVADLIRSLVVEKNSPMRLTVMDSRHDRCDPKLALKHRIRSYHHPNLLIGYQLDILAIGCG